MMDNKSGRVALAVIRQPQGLPYMTDNFDPASRAVAEEANERPVPFREWNRSAGPEEKLVFYSRKLNPLRD